MNLMLSLWEEVEAILREAPKSQRERYITKVEAILKKNGQFEDATIKSLLNRISLVRASLIDQISQMSVGVDSFRAAHMQALLSMIDGTAAELNERLSGTISDVLDQGWKQAVDDADDLISLVGQEVLPLAAPTDQLLIAQQIGADLVRRVSSDFRSKARVMVSNGILGAQSTTKVMADLSDLLKTQPSRKDQRLGSVAYQAERIVRTETNGIYALANQVRQQQVTEDLPGMLKQWIPAHDSRVRPAHAEAGRRYAAGGTTGPIPFDEAYIVGGEKMRFPHDPNASAKNRINCRCISILYRKEWFDGTEAAED